MERYFQHKPVNQEQRMRGIRMSPAQIRGKTSSEFSRCEERRHLIDHEKSLTPGQKTDVAIKVNIDRALWNNDVLQAIESYDIEVHVKDRVVHLDGHIASTSSQRRIQNAIRVIPGLLGIQNNLIVDDKLTLEVAGSLGTLEHTYGCKFFTGASHGVVSLNGTVNDENVKLLAEKRVSAHPNVRAVINNVHVLGAERELQSQPFLQPIIGQAIYFLNGVSGVVTQVIINPNNRRVVAMILRGQFADRSQDFRPTNSARIESSECLVIVPVDLIRYMTRVSGFLHISSKETKRYTDFDLTHFSPPANDWKAPYPYCSDDVLFPVENQKRKVEYQILEQLPQSPLVIAWVEPPLSKELLAHDGRRG
jgi:osmotically-inducible protein OsmY